MKTPRALARKRGRCAALLPQRAHNPHLQHMLIQSLARHSQCVFREPRLRVDAAVRTGSLVLGRPALRLSFADTEDGYHVGIHEFTHLLDAERTHFDGIPVGLPLDRHREWLELMEREMQSLRRGRSVLDPYGSEEPVEFLAVAVEAFFEIPLLLRDRHGELYRALSGYFGQDPAAWDEQRGRRACVST